MKEKTVLFEKLALTVSWIGIFTLLMMIARGAMAQNNVPPAGVPKGTQGFNNAYATPPGNPPPQQEEFYDDAGGEDDVISFDEPPPAPNTEGGIGSVVGGGDSGEEILDEETGEPIRRGGNGGSRASSGGSGISMGGGSASGVIERKKIAALSVDDHTGEGCRDVVTDFNFPDADIMDIAKTLGRLLGKNFILDNKDVKGRISIISNGPITCGDAWKAFLTALDMNGFALIPSGKYIRIARQRDARDKQLRTYTGEYAPDTDALITRLFPLKYLSSEEVARNFRSFMPANSRIIPYEQTNTVIVTDTGSNISKLQKLLEILDIEGFDAGIEVIPVKFASAVELSKLIDTLIPGTPQGGPPGAPRFGAGTRFNARRTKEGGIINTIIADERTNTLIIHANGKGTDQVRELVAKLDQKLPAQAGGGKVHVIYLQFADSKKIAETLNNISQGNTRQAAPAPGAQGGTGVNPVQQSLFEGSIRVSADETTNSLVVTASPADFVTVQRVVNRLDIPRDQVYSEVVIMEVTLAKDFAYSSNIVSPKNGVGLVTNPADLSDFLTKPFQQKAAIFSFAGGGSTSVDVGGKSVTVGNINALLKAIQTNTNANVLATPQILTLDNTEANFETTENIPVKNSVIGAGGSVSETFSKEPVTLSIKIKPQINKLSNFVKMEIDAKMTDISNRALPSSVANSAVATVVRNAKTSVVVGDSDTVVLGGLTRDTQSDSMTKIPILGDIPLLGWLFRSKESSMAKSNLLIFITPKIIRQYETIRTVLDKKLKERDDFLEATTGGKDPQKKYRDEMIRSLPDLKEMANSKPKTDYSIGDPNEEMMKTDTPTAPVGTGQ